MSASPTVRRANLDTQALFVLLICCTLWGLNQVAVKLALPEVPPLTQLAIRSGIAAALVVLWALLRGVPLLQRDGTLWAGVLAGTLFAGEFSCIFLGLQFTTASRMTVFLYLAPFFVALGMPWIAKAERLSATQWLGLLVAFGGVALAFSEGFASPVAGGQQWLGDALGVLAAIMWAGTTLSIRATRLASAAPEKTLAYQLLVATLLVSVGVAAGPQPVWVEAGRPLSVTSLLSLGFQAVVVTFASYLAWFWLIRHYAATRLATFTLLTPVAGLFFGALLLSEPITPRLIGALAAVVVGLVLINRTAGASAPAPSSTTHNHGDQQP